jgi:uncharacterized protein YjiS (DUF1127 family)
MSINISNPSALGKRDAEPASPMQQLRRQSWLDRFRAWRATRAAEDELFALSDRDLQDIGLARCDIPAAVRGERLR